MSDQNLKLVSRRFRVATSVRIPQGGNLSPNSIAELLHQLPHLSELEVHGVRWRATQKGSVLNVIRAPGPPLADLFPRTNHLRVVRITGAIFLGRDELVGLAASPELRVLELRGLRHLDDLGLQHLLSRASVPSCGNLLERLLLSDCTRFSALDFPGHSLKELELQHCVNVRAFRRSLPNLLKADLQFCTSLDDAGVEALISQAPLLEHLALNGCSRIQNPRIVAHRLRVLDCSLCTRLCCPVVCGLRLEQLHLGMGVGLQRCRLWLPSCQVLDLRNLPLLSIALHADSTLFRLLDVSGCNALRPGSLTVRLLDDDDANDNDDATADDDDEDDEHWLSPPVDDPSQPLSSQATPHSDDDGGGGGGNGRTPGSQLSCCSSITQLSSSSSSSSASSSSSSSGWFEALPSRIPRSGDEWGDGFSTFEDFVNGGDASDGSGSSAGSGGGDDVQSVAGVGEGVTPFPVLGRSSSVASTRANVSQGGGGSGGGGTPSGDQRLPGHQHSNQHPQRHQHRSSSATASRRRRRRGRALESSGSRHDYDVVVCGSFLDASSFPALDPLRVRAGGQPMSWGAAASSPTAAAAAAAAARQADGDGDDRGGEEDDEDAAL